MIEPRNKPLAAVRVLVIMGGVPIYGAEIATIEEMREIKDAGAEVLFVTNRDWGYLHVNTYLEQFKLQWVPIEFFGRADRQMLSVAKIVKSLWCIFNAHRRLKKLLKDWQPTHLYASSIYELINFWPWPAKIPIVWRQHNAPPTASWFQMLVWKYVLSKCSQVVSVSDFVNRKCKLYDTTTELTNAKKFRVVTNRIPQRAIRNVTVRSADEKNTRPRIVYVGQISEDKGFWVLCEALKHVLYSGRACQLDVVGAPIMGCDIEVRRKLKNLGIEDSVVMHGYLSDPTVIMSEARVHVLAALHEEAFGLVVAEAKSVSVPSIVSDRGALDELVSLGVDGTVVKAGCSIDLANAITCYLDNELLAVAQGKAAKSSISHLGLSSTIDAWIDVYKI